jgi:uncharacterized protein (TIGR03084 family)
VIDMAQLAADLAAETDDVLAMVNPLTEGGWERPTPAEGWTVKDQISHLAYFDQATLTALTQPDRFRRETADLMAAGQLTTDDVAARYGPVPPDEVLDWFKTVRADVVAAFAGADPRQRLPWYGPDMSTASAATARLMETWAHGQDVADALGVERVPSLRLRHVAHLGVSTFAFAFAARGRPAPDAGVRVELVGPGGEAWAWGDEAAAERVSGPAVDFCLVVTQRRHPVDTALRIEGPVAAEWMAIAQAFAGAPGAGRRPGQFSAGPRDQARSAGFPATAESTAP